jgi:acyl carrier protein
MDYPEIASMTTIDKLRRILVASLQLERRDTELSCDARLLGAMPEFDSMAVISVVTMIEDEFGITVEDDELSAEVFETLGSLKRFVDGKLKP